MATGSGRAGFIAVTAKVAEGTLTMSDTRWVGSGVSARDVGAGLGCLFQAVVMAGYYLAAFVLGSLVMAVAPIVLAVLVIIWTYIRVRLDEPPR